MTIPTQQASEIFLGNGVTNTFDFTFVGESSDNISVIYIDEDGATTTLSPVEYTIFLNPASVGSLWGIGGTVTYPISGDPIANGTSLTVTRTLPLTQLTSISNQGNFAPTVIERAMDQLEMQIQQVSGRTGQFRGTWITDTVYNFGDYVIDGANSSNTGNYYMCVIANTSDVWATELAAGDWVLVIDVSALGPISVVTGTANRITVTNPTTAPVIDIASTYVGQNTITTLGTIATGVWSGTTISPAKGGTGIANNAASTLTISGNFASTFTVSGVTAVTFPTSGTLLSTAAAVSIGQGGTGQTSAAAAFGALKQDATTAATGVVELATDAEVTTGTSTTLVSPVSSMVFHQGVAKAWVNFNGTGTPAINDSYNVTSITDNGVGDYTINFTTAFGNAFYCMNGWARDVDDSDPGSLVSARQTDAKTTSAMRIRVYVGNAPVDSPEISLVFFGDR